MLIEKHDGFVLGLEKVEEFCIDSKEDLFPMFKCQVFDCDGAFGETETFFKHLASTQHADNYFKVSMIFALFLF